MINSKSLNYLINIYIRDENLKPALSIPKALLYFIIFTHYINLVFLPYLSYFLIYECNLYNYFNYVFLIIASLIFSTIVFYIEFLFFYSSFHKITAITKCGFIKNNFFDGLSRQIILNNKIFILYM
jgi:hypothetical protein